MSDLSSNHMTTRIQKEMAGELYMTLLSVPRMCFSFYWYLPTITSRSNLCNYYLLIISNTWTETLCLYNRIIKVKHILSNNVKVKKETCGKKNAISKIAFWAWLIWPWNVEGQRSIFLYGLCPPLPPIFFCMSEVSWKFLSCSWVKTYFPVALYYCWVCFHENIR